MHTVLLLAVLAAPAHAADASWTDLLAGDSLAAFATKPNGWTFVEAVALDKADPKKFVGTDGTGVLVNLPKGRANDLYTKENFADVEVRLEFCMPKGSNSGLKFHGVYEIQLCDSFGKAKDKLEGDDCGGVYPRAELKPTYHHIDKGIAPKVNACKAPGEWQALEATFLSPRLDSGGKKTANAKIVKATLNGETIHENQELETPTGNNHAKKEAASGPLMLQGDHGPVAVRKFQVRAVAAK